MTQQFQPRTMDELGAAIYGEPKTPAPSPPPADPPKQSGPMTMDQLAERLYPAPKPPEPEQDLPAAVQALRNAPERKLYDPTATYAEAPLVEALEAYGIPAEQAPAETRAWANVFADAGLTSAEAREVVTLAAADITPEAAANWRSESEAELAKDLGANWRESQAWRDAQALVARDPRVKAFLDGGLGDSVRVIRTVIRAARDQRAAGRLK
jgi:hypothetical protein